jgi:ketosteroid isomerase-like protein
MNDCSDANDAVRFFPTCALSAYAPPRSMSVEENIEVVRRLGEALTNRDWAAFDDLVAEDCEWTDVPSGRTMHGRDELIVGCKSFTTEWSARGTHDAPLPRPDGGHYEPTGRSFARSGVGIVELRDRQIVRYRDYFDRQTMTEQLGLD